MANYKTGAQRHNDRMDKIWDRAKANGAFSDENLKKAREHENKSRDKKKIFFQINQRIRKLLFFQINIYRAENLPCLDSNLDA